MKRPSRRRVALALPVDVIVASFTPAGFVRRILDGQIPAAMPVQQGSRFGLYLNAAAARGLGLEIPTTIRLRAVEVIE